MEIDIDELASPSAKKNTQNTLSTKHTRTYKHIQL